MRLPWKKAPDAQLDLLDAQLDPASPASSAGDEALAIEMLTAGYRPSTSEPGHHQTMIQSLPLTLGVANDTWVVLDALRRQRNANDYTGQPISPSAVAECVSQAKALRKLLRAHLLAQHADLLKPAS
jgi:hypothetical protein